jgi:hypothetical protein
MVGKTDVHVGEYQLTEAPSWPQARFGSGFLVIALRAHARSPGPAEQIELARKDFWVLTGG